MELPSGPVLILALSSLYTLCLCQRKSLLLHDRVSSVEGFKSFSKVGIKRCMEYCAVRPACRAMGYNTDYLACTLLDVTAINASLFEESGSVFVNQSSWNMKVRCSSVECIGPHRCLTGHDKSENCVTEVSTTLSSSQVEHSRQSGYLLFEDDIDKVFHLDKSGQHLSSIAWTKTENCNFWSVDFDNMKVFWMCDCGRRLAMGKYNGRVIRFERYFQVKGERKYRWISVDLQQNVIFYSTYYGTAATIYKSKWKDGELVHPIPLRPTSFLPFQVDKYNRYVYWMSEILHRMSYSGNDMKNFNMILSGYFFMEFKGNDFRYYGCRRGKIITASLDAHPVFSDCEVECNGIWNMGNNTYILRFDHRGLWHVQKKTMVWKERLIFNTTELFVTKVG